MWVFLYQFNCTFLPSKTAGFSRWCVVMLFLHWAASLCVADLQWRWSKIVVYLFLPHKLFSVFISILFICCSCFAPSHSFILSPLSSFFSPKIQSAACWSLPFNSPDVSSCPHLCRFKGNLKHDTLSLRWQYLHNIKQIASGNMFQCLSTPHGVAGGPASISGGAAKTGVQNGESGCTW